MTLTELTHGRFGLEVRGRGWLNREEGPAGEENGSAAHSVCFARSDERSAQGERLVAVSPTKAKATRSTTKAGRPTKRATPSTKKAAPSTKKVSRPSANGASSIRPNGSSARRATSSARREHAARPDAIALLKADHRTVEKLFKSFEKAGSTAYRTKRKLVDDMIRELSVHAAIEEQFLYPTVRRELPQAEDDALEAIEEHHVTKWILSELGPMDPKHERFDAKVSVLIESVRHHVSEEEHELFHEIRAGMSRRALLELGAQLAEGKRLAPTRPHPRSPDEPPANLIVGAVAGVVDRARTAVTSRT